MKANIVGESPCADCANRDICKYEQEVKMLAGRISSFELDKDAPVRVAIVCSRHPVVLKRGEGVGWR